MTAHPPAGTDEQIGKELTLFETQVLNLIDTDQVVALLQALIRSPSDYPPGDTRAAIQLVANQLTLANVDFEILARTEHQPSLLATIGSSSHQKGLLFHSHIDTVSAGDRARWSVDPFAGEIRQGRVFGRGAGDDKGSVAAQVMALMTLMRAGVSSDRCVRLVVVADEESGALNGTQWLWLQGKLQAEALVIGEQTENRVAIAERVACGIDLTIFGTSAHGAMPWAGENAVLKAARALTWLQERLSPRFQSRRHPFLPPPTLNVGKIQGGWQWNIVPDSCKIEMDRRLLPGETRETAMAEIRQILDDYSAQVEPLRYELFSSGEVAANVDTPPDDPFVLMANRVLRDIAGSSPLTGYVQTSDGRWFARDGIPIIIFGPSDPAVGHATDEQVSIEQLVQAARFYTLLALRWMTRAY